MFNANHSGANAYARIGVETGVMTATPHRLTAMLFEGARKAIAQARAHLQAGNVAERGMAITKAIRIVNEGLLMSLDMSRGGDVAPRLSMLYTYITKRLLLANIESSDDMLAECDRLLATVEEGWTALVKVAPQGAAMAGKAA